MIGAAQTVLESVDHRTATRKFYCPTCSKPAEVVDVDMITVQDGNVEHVWYRVHLECHNHPGCDILNCAVDVMSHQE